MDSLQEYLDEQEQIDERFKIEDDSQANWALRKIAQIQKEMQSNEELAESEIHKIEKWLEEVNSQAQHSIDYFQSLLAEYAQKQREVNPKFKSKKLPHGRIRFRNQQPKWN